MHRSRSWLHTAPLLALAITFGLLQSSTDAAPPTRGRATVKTQPPKRIQLARDVQDRLSRPIRATTAIKHVPFTKKEVRERIPSKARPLRTSGSGPAQRASYSDIAAELNEIEKRLNAQGHSLRDNVPTQYPDHAPNRAKLDKQKQRALAIVDNKPARARLSTRQLRAKVRKDAAPPARASSVGRGELQALGGVASNIAVAKDFVWTPSYGESQDASGFLDARAHFSGKLDGLDSGLRGTASAVAGAYVFGQRYEMARIEGEFESNFDNGYSADVTLLVAGQSYPVFQAAASKTLSIDEQQTIDFLPPISYETFTTVGPVPVTLEAKLIPSLRVEYGAELGAGALMAYLRPIAKVDLVVTASTSMLVAEAGVKGTLKLIDVAPELAGTAYLTERELRAEVHARAKANFMHGLLVAYYAVGICPGLLCKEGEWTLLEYGGLSIDEDFADVDVAERPATVRRAVGGPSAKP